MAKGNSLIDVDEIKKRLDKALEEVAEEVGRELENAFENAVSAFYGSYSPRSYRRTLNTYYASSGYEGREDTYKRLGELKYEAGIKVDPAYMNAGWYAKNHGWVDPSPDFIFNRTWSKGLHGFTTEIKQKRGKFYYLPNAIEKPMFPGVPDNIFGSRQGWISKDLFKAGAFDERFSMSSLNSGSVIPKQLMEDDYLRIKSSVGDKISSRFSL